MQGKYTNENEKVIKNAQLIFTLSAVQMYNGKLRITFARCD